MSHPSVLVVCHANQFRSPLCAAAMRRAAPSLVIASAGVKPGLREGRAASAKVREVALGNHALAYEWYSVACTKPLLDAHDVVVYMDGGNLQRLRELRVDESRLVSLGDYCLPPRRRIADPAFMARGSDDLQDICRTIVEASERLALWLIAERPSAGQAHSQEKGNHS